MSAPISARSNHSACAAAVNMMPGGVMRRGPPNNPLLVRDDVGKAKPSCYDLPDDRFAYGRPGNHDSEGAREVSMYWVSHKPSPMPECAAPDFVWFNKRAASARVTTARDLAFYRKEHDTLTPRYGTARAGAPERVVPSDVMSGFAYGKKVRPSTPIDEVISHRFAEQAEDELKRFYTEYRDEHEKATSQVRKIPLTTACRGHATNGKKAIQQEEAREGESFKISKFKKILNKVDSGRSSSRRKSANQFLAELVEDKKRGGSQASERPDDFREDSVLADAYRTV